MCLDENGKAIRDTNSLVENAEKNIEDLDSKLHDILKENEKLRNDLEKYKAATDRVGDLNELSKSESMTSESHRIICMGQTNVVVHVLHRTKTFKSYVLSSLDIILL